MEGETTSASDEEKRDSGKEGDVADEMGNTNGGAKGDSPG